MKDKKLSIFEMIQRLAMANVENPDGEYVLRKVQRTFSSNFHVPITETKDIPMEDMLLHIFEDKYENMSVNERAKAARMILHSEEILEDELQKEDDDDAWAARIADELKEEEKNKNSKQLKKDKEKLKKSSEKLPDPSKLPPDIKITFEDN